MEITRQISASIMRLWESFSAADILAIALLLIAILLTAILLSLFRLTIDISKNGPQVQGRCKLSWFSLTLWSAEVSFQSAGDILQFLGKERGERDGYREEKSDKESDGSSEEKGDKESDGSSEKKGDKESDESARKKDVRTSKIPKNPVDAIYSLADLLIRLLRSLRLRRLSCSICVGLDDPADTAEFIGYLYMIAGVLAPYSARLSIVPWFHGERLEGDFMADIETRPVLVLRAVVMSLKLKQTRTLLKGILGWN